MRILVPAANMPAGPQQLRIKFAQSNNGIAYVAFGEEESPGVMKAGTITNLCFDGQVGDCTTAVSLKASELYTEWFDYTIDTAKNYYVSYLHLCGPGGPSSGTTPDGVAFSGYNTDTSDAYTYWSTSGTTTWYNALRDNGLAETLRGPSALVYGHYSRDPGASITGGWKTANRIEGIQGIESQASPTPSVAATGDPHLQNLLGERFDLMKQGMHVLINIPRGTGASSAMLRAQADAVRLGEHCGDLYFQELNVTGVWAEASRAGGYHYSVSQSDVPSSEWVAVGKVALKVVIAHTDRELQYLNVYLKHLGQSGFAVGGLLGEDDHEDASTPPETCVKRISLKKDAQSISSRLSAASIAVANLA
ncbi:unnamed protein product [Prorocentrum cordatum]|uniref:Uncharacterized protein n=2 Tax=Prorocentrum cordatum TaxID=2364126 RepID=A0ABN9Y7S9_9DINO|nr:unnamed protein product [Polarella glacialis]